MLQGYFHICPNLTLTFDFQQDLSENNDVCWQQPKETTEFSGDNKV